MTTPHAIILAGPSGVGKSTVAAMIAKNHNYKHCDRDEFCLLFSKERSQERSDIGNQLGYAYAKELVERKYNIVIEGIPETYIKKLLPLLKKHNYRVSRVRLHASIEQCVRNNAQRKRKAYDAKVIREVYTKYSTAKGDVIKTEGKTVRQLYTMIRDKYLR